MNSKFRLDQGWATYVHNKINQYMASYQYTMMIYLLQHTTKKLKKLLKKKHNYKQKISKNIEISKNAIF